MPKETSTSSIKANLTACMLLGLVDPESSTAYGQAVQDPVALHVHDLGMRLGLSGSDEVFQKLNTILKQFHQHGFSAGARSSTPPELALMLDAYEMWSLHPLQLMRFHQATPSTSTSAAPWPTLLESKVALAKEQAKRLRTEVGKQWAGFLLLSTCAP